MKKTLGYTLIEVLVVMTIIAVLAAIGVVSYTQAGKTARDGKRKADIESVRQALTLYRQETGNYPAFGSLSAMGNGPYNNAANALVNSGYLSAPYPVDPKFTASNAYLYGRQSSPPAFCLCAQVENTSSGNKNSPGCTGYGTTGNYYCAGSI